MITKDSVQGGNINPGILDPFLLIIGPGNYEVAKAAEKIHKGVPIATLGYLPRFLDLHKNKAPGYFTLVITI